MEFRVLGPIQVWADDRPVAITPGRQTALLAFLLTHANRVVSTDRILDALWGDEPPASGAKTVAFHVSRLRDALEPGRPRGDANGVLATEGAGYVLRAGDGEIDAIRFERLIAQGRSRLADDPGAARADLDAALALWRGEPFAEVADEPFAQPEIARLEELHLHALEDRADAALALGDHARVVGELEALVAANPLRERMRGQLMVALYRTGRQAEALRVAADGRRVLGDELGIDPGPELRRLEDWILAQDPRLDPPSRRASIRNPYKGLRSFEEHDSADFFGRETLVARLVDRLEAVARTGRLLVVVGPSGSGKSSAVRAGLIPALRRGALPGSERWRIAAMKPGTRPFRELAVALGSIDAGGPHDLGARLERDGDIAGAIRRLAPRDGRVVLVIDQLEELFSLVDDEAERTRFCSSLVDALADRDGRLLVVATLRADFLAHPLLDPALGELFRTGIEVTTPLTRDELERAIVRPAEAVGVQLEAGLAAEVMADVARQPGQLPLLQYALMELFERCDGQRLTREGYAAIGGVLGALGRQAEAVYASLDGASREIARQVFLRLVAPAASGEPTARRVARSELLGLSDDRARADEAIDAFGRGRMLSFDRDAATGASIVEVTHEAILTRWDRLGGWIEREREDLWTRRRLADAAADWIQSARDPGFLLTGSRLDLFMAWAAATDLRLDLPERELLDASAGERRRADAAAAARASRERTLERRATTVLRALVAVLAGAALVAGSLSIVVYGQGEAAREQAAVATSRELVAASVARLDTDPQLSLLLAWHAAEATADRGYILAEAMDALHWALQEAHVAYPADAALVAVRPAPDGDRGVSLLAPDQLMDLALSAAGRTLSTAECRTYLHRDSCPAAEPTAANHRPLAVSTTAGIVPADRLATGSLAGTVVRLVSQLPTDITPIRQAFEARTGIQAVLSADPGSDPDAWTASDDLPDVAIVSRPSLVAGLARAGLLVDLSGAVDVAKLRSVDGEYLVNLGSVAADGSWPAAGGRSYGVPFAVEAESLVWYPRAAFERAGYQVPRSVDELNALATRMVADGRTPWCLGIDGGGAGGANFVEELALRTYGPDTYDKWTAGTLGAASVRRAFEQFGGIALADDLVLGGARSVLQTPEDLASWPMFLDPPGCWLHMAGGSARGTWPAAAPGTLAAFVFPPGDASANGDVRGRVFMVAVLHDRPEVRRFVAALVGDELDAAAAASLEADGIWPLAGGAASAPEDPALAERAALVAAIRGGGFHADASDMMPIRLAAAFEQGTARYLTVGPIGLSQILRDLGPPYP